MTGLRAATVVLCCLAANVTVWAATLAELEQQVRAAVSARQTATDERTRLVSEAAALASTISSAERLDGPPRASAGLQRSLRDFDRIARRLDTVDRSIRALDDDIARLRRSVNEELERQSKQLSQDGAGSAYARASELEAVRRRIDELSSPPVAFRKLLVVRSAASDSATDLDRKIAILTSEQTRGSEALVSVRNNLSVLDARALLTRRRLEELTISAQGAPQDLRLVQRQVEEIRARLREIEAARDDLQRAQASIEEDLTEVQQQVAQCRLRRSELVSPR